MGILQARILEWVAKPSSRGSSQPGIEPRSPALQVDSLPSEPPGKPVNTGVGSLSLLQRIFPTQESSQGLQHCRWILYQLSYHGSPCKITHLHMCMYTCPLHISVGMQISWRDGSPSPSQSHSGLRCCLPLCVKIKR